MEDVLYAILGAATGFLAILGIIVAVISIIQLVGTWKYVAACGLNSPVLCLIPFVGTYVLANTVPADSTGNVNIFGIKIPKRFYVFYVVAGLVANLIPVIGSIASLVINIGCSIPIYQCAYARLSGDSADNHLGLAIASCFLPIFGFKFAFKSGLDFTASTYVSSGQQYYNNDGNYTDQNGYYQNPNDMFGVRPDNCQNNQDRGNNQNQRGQACGYATHNPRVDTSAPWGNGSDPVSQNPVPQNSQQAQQSDSWNDFGQSSQSNWGSSNNTNSNNDSSSLW